MATKAIDLEEVFPKYLGSRQEQARLAMLSHPGLIFKGYNMTGTYKYLNIKTKRMLSVENKGLLKMQKILYPWIASVHQKDKNTEEIQLHNVETEETKRLDLSFAAGESCNVILCNSSGILIVTDKQFYFINYATFGQDKPRTIALSNIKLLEKASNQFSTIEENKALIATGWQFQLWDIESGKCLKNVNIEKEVDPMPFQLLSLRDGVVIGSTLKKLFLWTESGMNTIEMRDPCSCYIVEGNKIFTAKITGQISAHEFPSGALIRELNVCAAAGMNFLEQMQNSRINDLVSIDELLFAIKENGEFQAWNTNVDQSISPLKSHGLKGKAKKMIKLEGKIYILVARKGKHEELVLYSPNVKRLLASNAAAASAQNAPTVGAGEVRKDGFLMVKHFDNKKGKRRYMQLRDNVVYEYTAPSDIAPVGTYVMTTGASIEITASKRQKIGSLVLHLNDKQFITLTAENAVEEDEWYKALNTAIRDFKFSSFSYSVPFASIQLVKDERGNVIKLGKGAESLVVRGSLNNRDVAVKLFNQNTPSKVFKNEIEILRFVEQLKILSFNEPYSALKHPCVMELVGACVKQPNLAIVQPLMLKGSLYDALHGTKKIEASKYTWKLYLKIANDIAQAMTYLHNFTLNNVKQPIIHRDLKPSNLLVNSLDADSNVVAVKLTDFGISAFGTKTENSVSGTTAYMAPEVQERGESVNKSDVYSFGIILWEMLTLALPPTVKRSPNDHARSTAPTSFPEYSPAELVALIKECTSVSPNMRPSFDGVIERLMDCTVSLIANDRINDVVVPTVGESAAPSNALIIPNKLYGREPEIKAVLKAFDRFKNGAKEILFIKGYSGIGKSSFIAKLSQYASTRGYVCSGKWTQQQRRIPYFAITQALSGLLNGKAKSWTVEEKSNWKNKFLYTFEETSRRVLFELIPEAKKIINDTPEGDEESGNGPDMANISKEKFNFTLVTFFKMLATSEHPLIIALDDLQWADGASFDLISALFTDPSLKYLLLVGTYRDNEVTAKHGLLNTLQDINAAQVTSVVEVRLPQLQSESVMKLLCDTFHVSVASKNEREELRELATIITTKTFGNPFFIHQFLQNLFLDNLVKVDAPGKWSWSLKDIKASKATDNVSDIVLRNINGLSKKTTQLLRLASHLTSTFTSKVLVLLQSVQNDAKTTVKPSHEEVKAIEETLSEAVRKGLLFMKSKHTYKFEHDEIQQVLYGMIDKAEKQATHYTIGKAFNKVIHSNSLAKSFPTITLFETVHQLNSGAELIKERAEFIQLSQLNLDAAKVAIHKMIAFESAYGFLQAAMKYMELDKGKGAGEKLHWNVNYDLCYAIYFELLHCEINQGLLGNAAATIEYLFQKVDNNNKLQKARLYEMKVHLQESQYQPLEACQTALDCLNFLGVLPEKTIVFGLLQNPAPVFALAAQVDATKISHADLRARASKTFVQQVTPEVDLANRVLLTSMISAILSGIVPVSSLFSLLWMKLMLENPGMKVSPYALFVYSSYCINFRGDMTTAVDLTKLAYNLLQDSNDPHRAIALLNTSTYLGFRMYPYKDVLNSMNKVYQMATEDGAFASVGYACIHEVYIMVMGGENVSQAIVKAEKWKTLMLAKRNFFIVFGINISLAILKLLRGDTLHNDTLTFEGFSQDETEGGLAHMPPVAVFTYLVYKMFAKCLFNRWEEAYEIQKRIIAECENPIKGFLFYAFWLFLAALVPLKLYKKNVTSKSKRHEYSALFDDYIARLKEYEMGGQNIQHWLDLLRAEEIANSFYRHSKQVTVPSSSSSSSSVSSAAGSALQLSSSPASSPSLTRKDGKSNLKDSKTSEKSRHLKYLEATYFYNKSKEHAINVGSLVFAGWAAEFCADFCIDLGWESMTRVYAYDALKLYEEASASSKVEHLKNSYEDILAEFTKVIFTSTDSNNSTDESTVNSHSLELAKQFGRGLLSQIKGETRNAGLRDAADIFSDYITNMDLVTSNSDSSDFSSFSSISTTSTSLETTRSTEIQCTKELQSVLSMIKLIQSTTNPEFDITHSMSLLIPDHIRLPLLLTPTNFKEIVTIFTVAFVMTFNQHSKYHLALFLEPSSELRIVFQLTDFKLGDTSAPLTGEVSEVPQGVKNALRPIEQLMDSVQAELAYCRVVRDQNIQNVLKMTCAFHATEK